MTRTTRSTTARTKRKTVSPVSRSARKTMRMNVSPITNRATIEQYAHKAWRNNPAVKEDFTMHLAGMVNARSNNNGVLNMMERFSPEMVKRAKAMASSARTIQSKYRKFVNIFRDEHNARGIVIRLQHIMLKIKNATYSSTKKKDFQTEIERTTGLVCSVSGASNAINGREVFTVEIGNDGFNPNVNLQGRIAWNRRQTIAGRRNETKPYSINGYRIRARFVVRVQRSGNGTSKRSPYEVTKVDVKSLLIAASNAPAEVHIQSGRAQGPEAWFNEPIVKKFPHIQLTRTAHVFATGIIIDALLRKRPSIPKFHHVKLAADFMNRRNKKIQLMTPVLKKLIRALQSKNYIDKSVSYVAATNNGVTNIVYNNNNPNNNNLIDVNDHHSPMHENVFD